MLKVSEFEDSLKKRGYKDEEIHTIKGIFTNQEIDKILFLKNYLVENFSEFLPSRYDGNLHRTNIKNLIEGALYFLIVKMFISSMRSITHE